MAELSLAGKAILVCGVTSGIGEATVRRLAGSRARVTFVGRCSARSLPATSAALVTRQTSWPRT